MPLLQSLRDLSDKKTVIYLGHEQRDMQSEELFYSEAPKFFTIEKVRALCWNDCQDRGQQLGQSISGVQRVDIDSEEKVKVAKQLLLKLLTIFVVQF